MLAIQSNQMKFHQLVALWTALSLCPFSLSEDVKLQELVQFASNDHGELKLPSRNTNKKNVIHEAKVLKQAIRNDMKINCSYFACTSDMWSSTQMKAFMALTLHFLTDDFCMQSYTLEVKPTQGKHTGDMIQGEMAVLFMKWNLDSACLTMMLQDSGSNMVKACTNWGIPHFPCIGHSLHLVVGPFLILSKKKLKKITI
jgi:hypothetical protein